MTSTWYIVSPLVKASGAGQDIGVNMLEPVGSNTRVEAFDAVRSPPTQPFFVEKLTRRLILKSTPFAAGGESC